MSVRVELVAQLAGAACGARCGGGGLLRGHAVPHSRRHAVGIVVLRLLDGVEGRPPRGSVAAPGDMSQLAWLLYTS